MISGASDKELDIAIARANVLLELQPKIDELKKENKQLKEQLQQKEDIINKVREYCDFVIREWITDDGFVEEVLKDVKEILDNKGE